MTKPRDYGTDWHDQRNARRRERYDKDPDYRAGVVTRSRRTYRNKSSAGLPDDPRKQDITKFGKVRAVNGMGEVMCFTKGEMAKLFDRTVKLFYMWVSSGRFPDAVSIATDYPVIRDYSTKKDVPIPQKVAVYILPEAEAAMRVLGLHLSQVHYFRSDHNNVIAALRQEIAGAR